MLDTNITHLQPLRREQRLADIVGVPLVRAEPLQPVVVEGAFLNHVLQGGADVGEMALHLPGGEG